MLNWMKIGAFAASVALSSAGIAVAQERTTLGTNPQGSLYYTVGGGMAAALQEKLGQQVTLQPHAGATVYLPLVAAGEVTIGLNSSVDTGAVFQGAYGGEPQPKLRMLARLWPLRVAIATRANDGMTEVKDLAGKRVVTDFAAMRSVATVNKTILSAGGVADGSVEDAAVSSLGSAMTALTEGDIDATIIAVGIPLTQQAQAAIPGGIRYLSITGDNATTEYVNNTYPGTYIMTVNPSPRLPEVTEPFQTIGYDVFMTISEDVSDERAAAILEALYDSYPGLKEDYPPIRGGSRDLFAQPSNTVPFHPGAVAFYKERGMWTAENDAREAAISQ